METSRRRSPSTVSFWMLSRMRSSSASLKSLILRVPCTPEAAHIACARARPMPKIAVSAISACWWLGMLMPAMRAIGGTRNYICLVKVLSTLTLLVARIGANHPHHALAPHDLALAADPFDRGHYLHSCSPVCTATSL